ncbi:hypothetical protein GUITHDRAFT_131771 [Guillardia theta CCMP2712]|uniref:OTU domain-containing protein n=1 Tax=Guillardia theta (strain CCMP2712) TaxID=905079 RepID=L1K2D6_GUITC|nr:hypothetical protein GUITHDRAFT_131771 [Guillardia theta CCMP2712]EKX54742.1 hypothetical protein GUITHDRAFT_131771 [Guillardia theta CCMP2712]|eukprot:XP_005841722.1 hypothetical protein GUITHDRAFT_131771 [Guillardia theta CCMP2712]
MRTRKSNGVSSDDLTLDNLPLGWKHREGEEGNMIYTTNDGIRLSTEEEARRYLEEKKMKEEDQTLILENLVWKVDRRRKQRVSENGGSKKYQVDILLKLRHSDGKDEASEMGKSATSSKAKAVIPSYLRSRFGDKGSAYKDVAPSRSIEFLSPHRKAKRQEEDDEDDDEEKEEEETTSQSRNASDHDENKCEEKTPRKRTRDWHSSCDNNGFFLGEGSRSPQLDDLRAFVMDRKSYWGDEIALRVFADRFKIASDGHLYLNSGMIHRLKEDCPQGWDSNLEESAKLFFSASIEHDVLPTLRTPVIRNTHTLRQVKSANSIERQCNNGTAFESWVIDGFPAGTSFVERIVCSRNGDNPEFTISNTPGDGDCLFYAMADVAMEVLGDVNNSEIPPEIHQLKGNESSVSVQVTCDPIPSPSSVFCSQRLRQMVSESLTEDELAFFIAANGL